MALDLVIEVSRWLSLILGFLHGRKGGVGHRRLVKLCRRLSYLGRQERASHTPLLGVQVLLNRTGLVVGLVGLHGALQELILHVPESELGLIRGWVRRLVPILAAVPAQLLEEGPGVD